MSDVWGCAMLVLAGQATGCILCSCMLLLLLLVVVAVLGMWC
jgi:hypothetical protein